MPGRAVAARIGGWPARDTECVSRENVQIVRRVYESWAKGDFSDPEPYHPDIRFEMPDWPEGASAHGVEEMSKTWFQALNAWDGFRSEPKEFIAHGPHVLVRNHITARGRESGLVVDADTASVFTLEDGRIVRLALYWNVERARRVAGLSADRSP